MKLTAEIVIYLITLDKEEAAIFNRKFPSSRDVEAWVEDVSEEGCEISFREIYDKEFKTTGYEITIETYLSTAEVYANTRSMAKRFEQQLKKQLGYA